MPYTLCLFIDMFSSENNISLPQRERDWNCGQYCCRAICLVLTTEREYWPELRHHCIGTAGLSPNPLRSISHWSDSKTDGTDSQT